MSDGNFQLSEAQQRDEEQVIQQAADLYYTKGLGPALLHIHEHTHPFPYEQKEPYYLDENLEPIHEQP